MTDGVYTGVVDRIVDGETAVILLEAEGETHAQLHEPVKTLPADAQHEGAVFDVQVEDGEVVDLAYRPGEGRERRERAQERFDRLSKRLDEE